MPVVPRCPRCQGVLAGTGQRERCLRCGETVVAVFRKLCSRCARDITRSPRVMDPSGEYFCHACWLEVCQGRETEPAFQCGECGGVFPGDQVYQEKTQYVCKTCFAARAADPAGKAVAALSGLAAAEQSPDTAPLAFVPSYYASTVAEGIAQRARRAQLILVLSLVGGTILIAGLTALLMWYRS